MYLLAEPDFSEKIFRFIKARKTLAVVAAVIFIFAASFVAYFLSAVDASGKTIDVNIGKGYGTKDVAAYLYDAGLIKSPSAFLIYTALTGSAHQLKPGSYKLSPAMSLPSIASYLVAGPAEDVGITVTEGETMAEIEKALVKAGVIKTGELTKRPGKPLEGFFFPDTYRFFLNSGVNDVIARFISNFYKKAMPTLKDAPDAYQALIIASIVEKEVPFSEDRPIVAGILYRRLAIGMALQVDSAPETYKYPGLPKTPISNPGADSIAAAVHSKKTDYLYYLSDPKTHKTIFSKTFDEHVANKFKYLR